MDGTHAGYRHRVQGSDTAAQSAFNTWVPTGQVSEYAARGGTFRHRLFARSRGVRRRGRVSSALVFDSFSEFGGKASERARGVAENLECEIDLLRDAAARRRGAVRFQEAEKLRAIGIGQGSTDYRHQFFLDVVFAARR